MGWGMLDCKMAFIRCQPIVVWTIVMAAPPSMRESGEAE